MSLQNLEEFDCPACKRKFKKLIGDSHSVNCLYCGARIRAAKKKSSNSRMKVVYFPSDYANEDLAGRTFGGYISNIPTEGEAMCSFMCTHVMDDEGFVEIVGLFELRVKIADLHQPREGDFPSQT